MNTRTIPKHQSTIEELHDEFAKESDRAAAILTTSLMEATLEALLKKSLVQSRGGKDQLFDGGNSPNSSFGSMIELAYRLGLISQNMQKSLNIFRRIRNQFAHEFAGCNFDNKAVKDRVNELIRDAPGARVRGESTREGFLWVATAVIWALNGKLQRAISTAEHEPEWVYIVPSDS